MGSDSDLSRYRGANTVAIDLGGRMAMPGIIDSHVHFLWGSYGLTGIRLYEANSLDEIQQALRSYAKAHPHERWVFGGGWYYDAFWGPERLPRKEFLDRIFPDQPVVIFSADMHSLWVNSKALELANITSQTHEPAGTL